MDFGKRLSGLRKEKGLTREAFASILGISKYTLRNYELGVTEPDNNFLTIVADFFDVSIDYLLCISNDRSRFNTYRITTAEAEHIKKYRQLDDFSKTVVDGVIDLALKRSPVEEKEDNIIRLPFSANKASAGTGYFLFDAYPDSSIDITLNKTTEKANECIAVSGNSMEPMFYDGDILLVKRQANIDEGQIGIFVKDGQGFVKKKGFDRLISLNPDYDDILPSEYDDINCYGLVLGKVNKAWIK